MTIFPCPFACRLVLSWLDRSKKTVDWWKFKEQLWIHLEGHLSLDKSDNLHYQHKSLFSDCSRDVLLIPGDAKGLRRDNHNHSKDVPNSRLFNKPIPLDPNSAEYFGEADMDTDSEDAEKPTDCELHIQLQAYTPVFIWAFNCLKLAIVQDDANLQSLETQKNHQKAALDELHGIAPTEFVATEPDNPIGSHFTLGTAADQRKDDKMKAFFEKARAKEKTVKTSKASGMADEFGRVPRPRSSGGKYNNIFILKCSSLRVVYRRSHLTHPSRGPSKHNCHLKRRFK